MKFIDALPPHLLATGALLCFGMAVWLFWHGSLKTAGALRKNHLFNAALVSFVISLCSNSSSTAAELEEGVKAYEQGDYKLALQLLRPLAEQGVARAQNGIGIMYANGRGVSHDEAQAAAWFQKAADQGYAKAQAHLGYSYKYGLGVPKDYVKAVALLQTAAEHGEALAQTSLGLMYSIGEGVARDDVKAAEYYRKAADQGIANAQYNLGGKYARGEGVVHDYVQATTWYRKAADQGYASAQLALGAAYHGGVGVPQDYVQAYKWFIIGDSRYRPWYALTRWKAKLVCFAMTWKMTDEQLADGMQLASDWKPRK
jgi:TPR repeat protein